MWRSRFRWAIPPFDRAAGHLGRVGFGHLRATPEGWRSLAWTDCRFVRPSGRGFKAFDIECQEH